MGLRVFDPVVFQNNVFQIGGRAPVARILVELSAIAARAVLSNDAVFLVPEGDFDPGDFGSDFDLTRGAPVKVIRNRTLIELSTIAARAILSNQIGFVTPAGDFSPADFGSDFDLTRSLPATTSRGRILVELSSRNGSVKLT